MTDTLTALLENLANEADPPPLDLPHIRGQARRRTRHKRLLATALSALMIAAVGAAGVAVRDRLADSDALQPAQHTGSAPPTEARLVQAVERSFPGTRIREINHIPAGPMLPGSSPYYAAGRSLAADELWFLDAHTQPAGALSVHWYLFDQPVTDDEADRYARGIFPDDPGPVPTPQAVRLDTGQSNTGAVKSLLYVHDNQQLVSYAWSTAGALVTATFNGRAQDVSRARVLDRLTRRLAGLREPADHGDGLLFPLEVFSRLADVQRVPTTPARVGEVVGERLVGCVDVARAVELANRDFTSDTDARGNPIRPTVIVRVVVDGTLRGPDGPTTLRVMLLFDAGSGELVSSSSKMLFPGSAPLSPLTTLKRDEQPCPPVAGTS